MDGGEGGDVVSCSERFVLHQFWSLGRFSEKKTNMIKMRPGRKEGREGGRGAAVTTYFWKPRKRKCVLKTFTLACLILPGLFTDHDPTHGLGLEVFFSSLTGRDGSGDVQYLAGLGSDRVALLPNPTRPDLT